MMSHISRVAPPLTSGSKVIGGTHHRLEVNYGLLSSPYYSEDQDAVLIMLLCIGICSPCNVKMNTDILLFSDLRNRA